MKFKSILLSVTMLLSLIGGSIFGIRTADVSRKETAETDVSSEASEDVSEGQSESGDSTETNEGTGDEDTSETSSDDIPDVVLPTDGEDETDPGIDTTKGKFRITMHPEKLGWYNDTAKIIVDVENISTSGRKPEIEKVEAKQGASGTWEDITDDMFFEINENCTVYVKVTDQYENEYQKSRLIKCFDTVAPTLNAAVNEGLLTVMTYDTESGVSSVYVNGYEYEPDENGIVSIRLEKFDATYQHFYVYALDKAGNPSNVYTITNPYWTDPNEESDDDDDSDPAEDLPDNAAPQTTGTSTAEVTSVTNEDGEDITNEVKGKQFYSIVTTDGQQYFLVIDMTAAQNKSGDTENTAYAGTGSSSVNGNPNNGTVYFLTSVSNQNLLNFTNTGEQTLPHNSVATSNGIDPYTKTPIASDSKNNSPTETTTDEEVLKTDKKDKKSGSNATVFIVLGIVAVVVIAVKFAGKKKGKPEQNDDALYGEKPDEDEIYDDGFGGESQDEESSSDDNEQEE